MHQALMLCIIVIYKYVLYLQHQLSRRGKEPLLAGKYTLLYVAVGLLQLVKHLQCVYNNAAVQPDLHHSYNDLLLCNVIIVLLLLISTYQVNHPF